MPILETIASLLIATVLGGAVGFERELRGRWAGLRTHMMVAMGSSIMMIIGTIKGTNLDHLMAGIVTGVGFIGAGTILKLTDRMEVKGLTTASSIWMAAAIGCAAGLGLYFLAFVGACLSLVILTVVWRFEPQAAPDPGRQDH